MNPARPFNCCTAHAAPDWSRFERLELAGCRNAPDGEFTLGGQSASRADFFTVYGRFPAPDGTCEAITDIDGARDALAVAAELAMLSGLICVVCPSLMEERPR